MRPQDVCPVLSRACARSWLPRSWRSRNWLRRSRSPRSCRAIMEAQQNPMTIVKYQDDPDVKMVRAVLHPKLPTQGLGHCAELSLANARSCFAPYMCLRHPHKSPEPIYSVANRLSSRRHMSCVTLLAQNAYCWLLGEKHRSPCVRIRKCMLATLLADLIGSTRSLRQPLVLPVVHCKVWARLLLRRYWRESQAYYLRVKSLCHRKTLHLTWFEGWLDFCQHLLFTCSLARGSLMGLISSNARALLDSASSACSQGPLAAACGSLSSQPPVHACLLVACSSRAFARLCPSAQVARCSVRSDVHDSFLSHRVGFGAGPGQGLC